MACAAVGLVACSSGGDTATTASTAAVATSTTAPAGPTTTFADDSARAEASAKLFEGITADQPGCTAAVARDGVVVWAQAYGAAVLDPLAPLTTESVVDIGSTSKQFTATAIALLIERGQLNMADALGHYLPSLPSWSQTVTVGDLVHHTSGIPDYVTLLVDQGATLTAVTTDADALRVLTAVTATEFAPGDHFSYSNSNYFLLGQVVQKVTGEPLGSFVQREIFQPLGMAAVMDPTAKIATKAVSYTKINEQWIVNDSPWTQVGDGGVQTTPTELVKWASQYWAPTIGDADINTLRMDGAAVDPQSGGRYGFGIGQLSVGDVQVLSHGGSWGGFVTTFIVAPDLHLAVAGTCTSPDSVPATASGDPGLDLLQIWR